MSWLPDGIYCKYFIWLLTVSPFRPKMEQLSGTTVVSLNTKIVLSLVSTLLSLQRNWCVEWSANLARDSPSSPSSRSWTTTDLKWPQASELASKKEWLLAVYQAQARPSASTNTIFNKSWRSQSRLKWICPSQMPQLALDADSVSVVACDYLYIHMHFVLF